MDRSCLGEFGLQNLLDVGDAEAARQKRYNGDIKNLIIRDSLG